MTNQSYFKPFSRNEDRLLANPRTRYSERGFTLLEMLVGVVISSLVLAALASTFMSQSRTYRAQEHISEMQQGIRATLYMMTQEIRMAGYNPTGATFDGITYDTSQLRVKADLNGDGDVLDSNEDIIYSYDGGSLRIDRNANGTTEILAENILSFSFSYLDSNGNATTTSANIRQMQISIIARTSEIDADRESDSGYWTLVMRSVITPRNLAYA